MTERTGELHEFTVAENFGERLDIWLGYRLEFSRSQLKKLIDQGSVTVNGDRVKAGYKVQEGDRIEVLTPEPQIMELKPEPIPLEIIYEDEELAVINKQRGLVVHPGPGNLDGTMVNALLAHVDELAKGSGDERPGIVHRLDKDTSGLIMVAKNNDSFTYLTDQLKKRFVERHYLALVQGVMPFNKGMIEEPIGRHPKDRKKMAVVQDGREAKTLYEVKESFSKHSLVECRLVTGRTHQIRVHFSSIHHPLVGDTLYGFKHNNLGARGQVLHAYYLAFTDRGGRFREFRAEPDGEFLKIVEKARQLN